MFKVLLHQNIYKHYENYFVKIKTGFVHAETPGKSIIMKVARIRYISFAKTRTKQTYKRSTYELRMMTRSGRPSFRARFSYVNRRGYLPQIITHSDLSPIKPKTVLRKQYLLQCFLIIPEEFKKKSKIFLLSDDQDKHSIIVNIFVNVWNKWFNQNYSFERRIKKTSSDERISIVQRCCLIYLFIGTKKTLLKLLKIVLKIKFIHLLRKIYYED